MLYFIGKNHHKFKDFLSRMKARFLDHVDVR